MPDNSINIQLVEKFIIDRNETLSSDKYLAYHRNGMFQTVKNTEVFSTNEPSTLECISLPNKYYFGKIKLTGDERFLVFTGDNKNISEIGIIDLKNCIYKKIVSSKCLNFRKKYNPITGAVRLNSDNEEEIIFIDGTNTDKLINLSKIPFKYKIDDTSDCKDKIYTNELDCDQLNLNPSIKYPCVEIRSSGLGNLPDGIYFISIAYLIKEDRFSDYMSSSLPITINNESGKSSISINFTNLDRDFERYQILLTGIVNGITTHKIIGKFYTSQHSIHITDWVNEEYQDGVPSSELTIRKKIYDSSGIINANSETLFRADVKRKSFINYQKQAFNIETNYIVKRKPLNYYKTDSSEIGYFRNEIARFFIRWYYTDGEVTALYHVIGPKPTGSDLAIATGNDKFEKEPKKNYEIYNTAQKMIKVTSPNSDIIGYGKTGFWQSEYKYPDDKEIYGDYSCKNMIDHMIPDEEKVQRYEIIDGETYINIIGFQFSNIEHPKDENGNYIENISHYEIVRLERDEANSRVVARGIVTNMGGYTTPQKKDILYSNFPYNDISPNQYLSKKQTYKKGNVEKDFQPLDKFYSDKFSFYTPFGNYFGRKSLSGTYLNVESISEGEISGYFEETYNHPRFKLLTNFSLYFSLVIGAIESYILTTGNKKVTKNQQNLDTLGTTTGTNLFGTVTTATSVFPTTVTTFEESFLSLPRWRDDIKNTPASQLPIRILINTLKTLVSLGAFVFKTALFAFNAINVIRDFSQYQQYARQYNSECFYNSQKFVKKGQKRRKFLRQPFYLDNGIHSIGDLQINNGGRNSSIFIELDKELSLLKSDNSRKTMTQAGLGFNDNNKVINSKSSVYYVSLMKNNPNQYGSIENTKIVKTHSCPINIDEEKTIYTSPYIFGGDCIIAEETHVNKFPLFKQTLANTNYPDGTPYDYRLYNNVGFARFWIDTSEYDMGNMVNIFGKSTPNLSKLPNQKFNLDLPNSKKNEWIERDQIFYTSVNGVIRYIVEVPYNISFRKNNEEGEGNKLYQPHYSDSQKDLSYIFRSDLLRKHESFILDPSYQYLNQIYTSGLSIINLPKKNEREINTVLYSLPSYSNTVNNNWRYFLGLNRFTFDLRDFGQLTGLHALDQDRLIFLFSKASPYISLGRSVLELKNQTITIGDGGIFAQAPREIMKTDVYYGSNHDRYAFSSTQFGHFYVSEYQGKLFNFSDKLNEISKEGFHKWSAEFLPLNLKSQFPNWTGVHNPINGVGYKIVFDNIFETVYFCKRDYIADEKVTLNEETQEFEINGVPIELGDTLYFQDMSMTLSYSPLFQSFQSFHDWFPDDVIQQERHFSTVKKQKIWKHNIRKDSFCNFYGEDKPYQVGIIQGSGKDVTWLQSVEYMQEAYIYKTNSLDRYHVKDETFNNAIIFNSEQCSGLLNLKIDDDIRYKHTEYPKFNGTHSINIPLEKVENRFRFNMFYDYTKERDSGYQPIVTKRNGYDFIVNQPYLDFDNERPPRFRHMWNILWLSREKSGNIQFITKFINTKLNYSHR